MTLKSFALLCVLALLCSLPAMGQHVCASGADCTTTGANQHNGSETFNGAETHTGAATHSGPEDFRIINNVYYTSPAIDPTAANECVAIAGAWAYAVSKGWTGLRVVSGWKNTQNCGASDMFAGFPYLLGRNASFTAQIDLDPSNRIRVDTSVVVPAQVTIDGHTPPGAFIGTGATFQPSATFPTSTPVLVAGATDAQAALITDWATVRGTPPEGVRFLNLQVDCSRPNGTFIAGSIGIQNHYSQEGTVGRGLRITNCSIGIERDNFDIWFGPLDDGPWEDLHIDTGLSNDTNSRCIRNGFVKQTPSSRGFKKISCNLGTATVKPNFGMSFDGINLPLEDLHLEGFNVGVTLGNYHYYKGGKVSGVECVGFPSGPAPRTAMDTCVQLSNLGAQSGATAHNVIEQINTSGVQKVFCDLFSFGGCVDVGNPAAPTLTAMGLYVRDLGPFILSSNSQIASIMPQSNPVATVRSASYTAVSGDNGNTLEFSCSTPCTLSLPNPPPSTGWNVTVISYGSAALTVDPSGATMNGSAGGTATLSGGSSHGIRIFSSSTNYYYDAGNSSGASVALDAVGNPAASHTVAMGGFQWTLQSSAAQAAAPLVISGSGTNVNAYSLFTVSTAGTNEKTFTFTNSKSQLTHSTGSGDLQLLSVTAATSGAQSNAFNFLTQGQYWDGSVTRTANFTTAMAITPSSGTATTLTMTPTISFSGAALTKQYDLTAGSWRVMANNIRSNTASNTDIAGTIAVSASTTGTYTFAGTYTSSPICILTPITDPTAVGVYWATTTTTVLTANVTTSGTITFNYHCIGRN